MNSKILKLDEASKIAFDFNPQKFPVSVPQEAQSFTRKDGSDSSEEGQAEVPNRSNFKLNELIAGQIGVSETEKKETEAKVDALAVEKVKAVQEEAYKEAYEIGLEEGRQKAFEETKASLEERIESLDQLIKKITFLKKDLVSFNESHLLKAVASVAGKIALKEIQEQNDSVIDVIRSVMDNSQSDERVKIKISEQDFEFLESVKDELSKKIENFETIKFEVDSQITSGGCIVEGNYGVIDATVEQRVEKAWQLMLEKTPTVKDRVG